MPRTPPTSPKKVIKSTRTVPPGPINSLNPSIFLDIFAQVHSVHGLATCSLVCRLWHALVCSSPSQQTRFCTLISKTNFFMLPFFLFFSLLVDMDLCIGDGPFFLSKWHKSSPSSHRYEIGLSVCFVAFYSTTKPSLRTSSNSFCFISTLNSYF